MCREHKICSLIVQAVGESKIQTVSRLRPDLCYFNCTLNAGSSYGRRAGEGEFILASLLNSASVHL